ncbi:unnamed protein product [Adineta steineri]|uniref:Profilin n=1 Tax=Adineta steineri TaxID=433720 RepID=A0A819F215_9BILA|nr:unnamed protein product [Adineta steineri]CAF0827539.1 unnamed protein product [Adineta steineri]CAF0871510.1 unnamed protein product [Adineta steineri]CAF3670248.1 unnamed protein product [Adineta steineri]CAF3715504.1 unnamed protein product [Adineta steineri]
MAGWDQYITNLTSQGVTHAGIFGNDGSRWAASSSFPNIDHLRDELPKAFSAQPSGIVVNGEKYIFIRNQDHFAVFRKGADGMVIVKLNQAYIVSIGVNQKPEMLVGATSKIGEYLKNCGY